MSKSALTVCWHPDVLMHDPGRGCYEYESSSLMEIDEPHPESADRIVNIHSILERGDIEEALRAASAIGDDTIQRRSRGYVVPDAFTHGSAEQRVRWFRLGLERGSMKSCNTFEARQL